MPVQLGPEYYQSYTASMPLSSHWRRALCEEVDCSDFLSGFVFTCDISNELGVKQYQYLAKQDKDRSPSIQRVSEHIFKFVYKPGTPCMKRGDHRLPIGKEPIFLVRGGDWRGNPRQIATRRHTSAEFWVEDFAQNQDRITTTIQKG